MEISPELISAKEALEDPLLDSGLITGIDFGLRDEDNPDPDDLALRFFVADLGAVPPEVSAAADLFPFPTVIIQRVFDVSQGVTLPDTSSRPRPVEGGVSVSPGRFASSPTGGIAGTLGAIVTDAANPEIRYGISNFHVLCVDAGRMAGQEILQPEPSFGGPLPEDRLGTLDRWAYPETTLVGFVDAALCLLEVSSVGTVADIGPVFGTVAPTPGLPVTKRGRTTGQTFGIVTGFSLSVPVDYPRLPPVTDNFGASTTMRHFKLQFQIRADFPSSIVFGEHGDSGSVVVSDSQVVGLYWGSGSDNPGDPQTIGVASPALFVETELGIRF